MEDTLNYLIIEAIFADIHVAEAVLEKAGIDVAARRRENEQFIKNLKVLAALGLLGYNPDDFS